MDASDIHPWNAAPFIIVFCQHIPEQVSLFSRHWIRFLCCAVWVEQTALGDSFNILPRPPFAFATRMPRFGSYRNDAPPAIRRSSRFRPSALGERTTRHGLKPGGAECQNKHRAGIHRVSSFISREHISLGLDNTHKRLWKHNVEHHIIIGEGTACRTSGCCTCLATCKRFCSTEHHRHRAARVCVGISHTWNNKPAGSDNIKHRTTLHCCRPPLAICISYRTPLRFIDHARFRVHFVAPERLRLKLRFIDNITARFVFACTI